MRALVMDPFLWYVTMLVISLIILSAFIGNVIFIFIILISSIVIIRRYERMTTKANYMTKARGDMEYIRISSPYVRCDKCKETLGLGRMIRKAFFKKRGSTYRVICKNCGHENFRIKGAFSQELDKRWNTDTT